jgi:hypothetical protein
MRTEGAKIVLRAGCSLREVADVLGNGVFLFESNKIPTQHGKWMRMLEVIGIFVYDLGGGGVSPDDIIFAQGGIARHILMEVHG